MGCVPLVLAFFAFFGGKATGRTIVAKRFALFAVLTGFVLALGSYSPLHTLVESVPVLGNFRFPCRAIVLVQLGVMMLAAIGFSQLLAGSRDDDSNARHVSRANAVGDRHGQRGAGGRCAVRLDRAYCLVGPNLDWSGLDTNGHDARAVCCTREPLGGIACWSLSRRATCASMALSYAVYREPQTLERFIARNATPPAELQRNAWCSTARARHIPAYERAIDCCWRGYSRADGYAGLEPARALDYRTLPAQRVAGANWARADLNRLPGTPRGQATWQPVHDPMPRARVVNQVIESDEPRIAIHTVDVGFDRHRCPRRGIIYCETDAVTGATG